MAFYAPPWLNAEVPENTSQSLINAAALGTQLNLHKEQIKGKIAEMVAKNDLLEKQMSLKEDYFKLALAKNDWAKDMANQRLGIAYDNLDLARQRLAFGEDARIYDKELAESRELRAQAKYEDATEKQTADHDAYVKYKQAMGAITAKRGTMDWEIQHESVKRQFSSLWNKDIEKDDQDEEKNHFKSRDVLQKSITNLQRQRANLVKEAISGSSNKSVTQRFREDDFIQPDEMWGTSKDKKNRFIARALEPDKSANIRIGDRLSAAQEAEWAKLGRKIDYASMPKSNLKQINGIDNQIRDTLSDIQNRPAAATGIDPLPPISERVEGHFYRMADGTVGLWDGKGLIRIQTQ